MLSVIYHDARGAADSAFRIQWDAPHIRYLSLEAAIPLVTAGITFTGMVYVTFWINWQLAVIALTIAPVVLLVSQAYRVHLRHLAHKVTDLESASASVVQEVLGALRVVKAFGREGYEQARFARRSHEGFEARIRYESAEGVFAFVIGLSLAAGTAIVLYVGIRQVQSGIVSLGDLLLVMSYLLQLYEPLRSNHTRKITWPECPDLRQIGQRLCLGLFPGRCLEDRSQRRHADGLVCADQPRPERSAAARPQ